MSGMGKWLWAKALDRCKERRALDLRVYRSGRKVREEVADTTQASVPIFGSVHQTRDPSEDRITAF
jgi:hypothetical protein